MPVPNPPVSDEAIADIIARTPEWVRTGLSAHDQRLREQAEAALAAMIAAALKAAS